MLHSTDGESWETIRLPDETPLWSIAYGNGRYVATGNWLYSIAGEPCCSERGVTFYSTDGRVWQRASGVSGHAAVAFSAGRFWLGVDFVSLDGESWTPAAALPAIYSPFVIPTQALMYAAAVVSDASELDIYSSSDGTAWTLECQIGRWGGDLISHEASGGIYLVQNEYGAEQGFISALLSEGMDVCNTTLAEFSSPPAVRSLHKSSDGLLVASGGGIFFDEASSPAVWENVFSSQWTYHDFAASPDTIVGVGDGGAAFSRDDGRTFEPAPVNGMLAEGGI